MMTDKNLSKEEVKNAVMAKIIMAAKKWSTGDTLGYVECAAEDVVWIDDLAAPIPIIGRKNLQKYLEGFKGQVPSHIFELKHTNFQMYNDMVIVCYHYQGIFDGEPADPWKVTSIYHLINGDWLSVHENWSEVKKQ